MRVLYLSSAQIPSRSTNALQVMRMCEGFRCAGADVTLVHPSRIGNRPEGYEGDLWRFYGIEERFRIVSLPTPLTRRAAQLRVAARAFYAAPLTAYLACVARPGATPFVSYVRSPLAASLLLEIRRRLGTRSSCKGVLVEIHDEPRSSREWATLERADGVVATSAALSARVTDRVPALRLRTSVEHNGVDVALFGSRVLDRKDARKRLAFSDDSPLVVYAGRVNMEKGAGVLIDAAALLPHIQFLLVGRVYEAMFVERSARLKNVTLTGYVPPAQVPVFVAAADALVLPSTDALTYADFTSPLKLFEYMASRRPIVASDLPVLSEILQHERNALLFDSRDPNALVDSLLRILMEQDLAARLSRAAFQDVQQHSWENRASRVLKRFDKLSAASSPDAAEAT